MPGSGRPPSYTAAPPALPPALFSSASPTDIPRASEVRWLARDRPDFCRVPLRRADRARDRGATPPTLASYRCAFTPAARRARLVASPRRPNAPQLNRGMYRKLFSTPGAFPRACPRRLGHRERRG
jgi:hypothetical protein